METGELGSQYFLNEGSSKTPLHNSLARLHTQHIKSTPPTRHNTPSSATTQPCKPRIRVLPQFAYARNTGKLNTYRISLILKSDTHEPNNQKITFYTTYRESQLQILDFPLSEIVIETENRNNFKPSQEANQPAIWPNDVQGVSTFHFHQ